MNYGARLVASLRTGLATHKTGGRPDTETDKQPIG